MRFLNIFGNSELHVSYIENVLMKKKENDRVTQNIDTTLNYKSYIKRRILGP